MSQGKWCHFKQRLQRPLSLKSAKAHATLDWEDEPFSFVAFGRNGLEQQKHQQEEQRDEQPKENEQKQQQPLNGGPARPLLEGQSVQEQEWGWGRVLWPTIHVSVSSL
jgi:hypothetical protein